MALTLRWKPRNALLQGCPLMIHLALGLVNNLFRVRGILSSKTAATGVCWVLLDSVLSCNSLWFETRS